MATKHQVTCIVKGISGNMGKIVLPDVDTIAKAQNFLTNLAAFHEGEVISISHTETLYVEGVTVEDGNTDRKGIISYRDNTETATKRISFPCWGTDAGESVKEADGERIPSTCLNSIIENLQTASGHDLTALYGYVIQKR